MALVAGDALPAAASPSIALPCSTPPSASCAGPRPSLRCAGSRAAGRGRRVASLVPVGAAAVGIGQVGEAVAVVVERRWRRPAPAERAPRSWSSPAVVRRRRACSAPAMPTPSADRRQEAGEDDDQCELVLSSQCASYPAVPGNAARVASSPRATGEPRLLARPGLRNEPTAPQQGLNQHCRHHACSAGSDFTSSRMRSLSCCQWTAKGGK